MTPDDSIVKWLVIIGEPEEVEMDTFTSTGYWLVQDPSKTKSFYDELFNNYIEEQVNENLRKSINELRITLYPKPLEETALFNLLRYLESVKANGNNHIAMAENLTDLGLLPSKNEDSIKPYNLKRNKAFCEELTTQLSKLEDIDYWIEENVLEEEKGNFRNLIRSNRDELTDVIQNISEHVDIERVINIDEPDKSPLNFVKKTGISFTNGVSMFITGNSKVFEVTEKIIKIKYAFTRVPLEDTEKVAISINDGQCYILSGFVNREGEVVVDLENLKIDEIMEEPRVYKWTIGLLDPEKLNTIKKGAYNRYEFYVFPNFETRSWNVFEENEGFTIKDNQCFFEWEDELNFKIVGNYRGLKAELNMEIEEPQLDNEEETKDTNIDTNISLPVEGNRVSIGSSELKQIRNNYFSVKDTNLEEVQVNIEFTDNAGNIFILSFLIGDELELTSTTSVNSIEEGIIRFLHQDNKNNMHKDHIINQNESLIKVKMLGGGGHQIRFRIYQEGLEDRQPTDYSIQYPTILRDIEKNFFDKTIKSLPEDN